MTMAGAALIEEFGRGDARTRAESWRHSRNALRALEQNAFVDASRTLAPSDALAARFDWPEISAQRRVILNGGDGSESIELADGARLHLVHVSLGGDAPSRWRHRLRLKLPRGSAEIVEHFLGEGGEVLGASTIEIELGPSARLSMTTLVDLHDAGSLYRRESVALGAGAALESTHLLFGGRFQRHDLGVALGGRGARMAARGAFALRGRAHADVHLDVAHETRDTTSDVAWRGVVDQRARGILHGAIAVDAGADGTDARLETKNILLSPHAEIDAQPVLEINADEVKASHGATVGQLDERALFYLRSRGVPLEAARALLIASFCRGAFALVPAPLRARLEALLAERLPQAAEAAAP